MEIYCVTIIYEKKDPFEIIFSALSEEDARLKIKMQYAGSKIISIHEFYSS